MLFGFANPHLILAASEPTAEELTLWVRVLFYIAGGLLCLVMLFRQFSSKPPTNELDKAIQANTDRIAAITQQITALVSEDAALRGLLAKEIHDLYNRVNPLDSKLAEHQGEFKQVAQKVLSLEARLDGLPDRIISTLRNAGALRSQS